jgi:Asp-tRNA(Asn)/Glu-tRNA(Gln) amidotransferase A subunit family amidase
MGVDDLGLPLGLQFVAPLHQEASLLRIATSYETAAGVTLTPPH